MNTFYGRGDVPIGVCHSGVTAHQGNFNQLAQRDEIYPHDRPTWDLTSVLHAVRPDRSYFDLSPRGRVSIMEDGQSTFIEDANGRDRYLIVREEQKGRTLEAQVPLSSQPSGVAVG